MARAMVFRTPEQIQDEFQQRALVLLSSLKRDIPQKLKDEYKRHAKDFMDKANEETPELVDPPLDPPQSLTPPSSFVFDEPELVEFLQPSSSFDVLGNINTLEPVAEDAVVEVPAELPTEPREDTSKAAKAPNYDVYEFKDDSSSENEGSSGEIQTPPTTTIGLEVIIRTTQQKPPPILRMEGFTRPDTQQPSSQKEGKKHTAKKTAKYQSTRKLKAKKDSMTQETTTQSLSSNLDNEPSTSASTSPFAMFRQTQRGTHPTILDFDAVEGSQPSAINTTEPENKDRADIQKSMTNSTPKLKGVNDPKVPKPDPKPQKKAFFNKNVKSSKSSNKSSSKKPGNKK